MSNLKKANLVIPPHMPSTDKILFCNSANEVDRKIIKNFCKFQKVKDIIDGYPQAQCDLQFSDRKSDKKDKIRQAWYSCRKT